MMNVSYNDEIKTSGLFEQSDICLFELSDAGTILYCRTDLDPQLNGMSAQAVGRNFFDEVSPFENTEELRPLPSRFAKSDYATEKFTFDCRIKNQIVPAKIMPVRVSEQSGGERGKTIIVDIRKF